MKLKFTKNDHGCEVADFTDLNGAECSIQESSLATEAAIRMGVNDGVRMHLSQDQVAALLPALQHFVATGWLPRNARREE